VKSKKDPRHLHRLKIMRSVFAWQFQTQKSQNKNSSSIVKNIKKIDQIIKKSAPKWPIKQINKVDLAILRTACWELLHQPKTPAKVIIDEAVELAKEFGTKSSASFVNGVLGTVLLKIKPKNAKSKTTGKKTKN